MDTSWKNWTLTMGSAIVAGLIATGNGQIVADAVSAAADTALWLVRPLGPRG